MKTIKNDYCIRQFVGSDTLRPAMAKVNFQDGYLYSTDAYIAAKIKADLCVHNYIEVEKYPNVKRVFIEHKSIEKKTVTVDTLFNDLMRIECCFKPKMIDCDNCNGDGVFTCEHCGSEYDCKECGGTGKTKSNELELTNEHDCFLFNKKYKLKYLDLIIRTAVYTGVKEIKISNSKGTNGTLFSVGGFFILLMPLYS
ncbi:MAG: hypothetical protein PHU98_06355 [Mariniphaga sp.]|nr:hypothetical protein [Paludibacter sp.]MDD4225993.1 hypothetical protein [Mariniphaga sp.]